MKVLLDRRIGALYLNAKGFSSGAGVGFMVQDEQRNEAEVSDLVPKKWDWKTVDCPPDPPGDGVPPDFDDPGYVVPRPLGGAVPVGAPFSPDEILPDDGVFPDDGVLSDDVSAEELASYKNWLWDCEQWLMQHEEIIERYQKWLASYRNWLPRCQDWVQRMEAELIARKTP